MTIGSLQVEKKYPIPLAERIGTRFGSTILLSLQDPSMRIFKVFIPRRYCSSFSDTNIEEINLGKVSLGLIYKGTCVKTKSYILAIEEQQ
jgi:hypothetical protein